VKLAAGCNRAPHQQRPKPNCFINRSSSAQLQTTHSTDSKTMSGARRALILRAHKAEKSFVVGILARDVRPSWFYGLRHGLANMDAVSQAHVGRKRKSKQKQVFPTEHKIIITQCIC
jgi:hypothetical protein